LVWAVVLGVSLLGAGPAYGFCRTTTTTSSEPPGYDPAVDGCWTDGVPLAWTIPRVPYAVAAAASNQVSLADATRVADLAFGAWNGAQCGGQSPAVTAYDDGPLSVPQGSGAVASWAACPDSSTCDPAAHDVIVFDDDGWPYDDPVNTLALTTVTFGAYDGRILQVYTEVNSAQHPLTTAEPPSGDAKDLQAILTHEAGHFLGFAHATDTSAVMYAYYQPGAIDLTADDVDAMCTVYSTLPSPSPSPPSGPASIIGCSCSHGGTRRTDAVLAAAAVGAGLVLLLARRRRRT
jgi:hypothetical protein